MKDIKTTNKNQWELKIIFTKSVKSSANSLIKFRKRHIWLYLEKKNKFPDIRNNKGSEDRSATWKPEVRPASWTPGNIVPHLIYIPLNKTPTAPPYQITIAFHPIKGQGSILKIRGQIASWTPKTRPTPWKSSGSLPAHEKPGQFLNSRESLDRSEDTHTARTSALNLSSNSC